MRNVQRPSRTVAPEQQARRATWLGRMSERILVFPLGSYAGVPWSCRGVSRASWWPARIAQSRVNNRRSVMFPATRVAVKTR